MAVTTTTGKVHINESLDQIVHTVANDETPFVASLKKEKIGSTKHEWLLKSRKAASLDNALVEGADASDSTMNVPTRVDNYTQIFGRVINVSDTMDAVDTVGGKESAQQIIDAGIEIKNDMEMTFLSAQAAANGNGGTARRLRGAQNWVTTNVVTNASVTEAKFRDLLVAIFKAGGKSKKAFVSPETKGAMNAFTGNAQKQQDASKATIYGATDIYVSDYGTLDIIPSLYIASTVVLVVDPDQWALGQLRKLKTEDLAKTGDSTRKQLITECTLISKNERGNGILKPSV